MNKYKCREILVNGIKGANGIAGFMSFFSMLGTVGGMEQGLVSCGEGIIRCVVSIAVMAVTIMVSNEI